MWDKKNVDPSMIFPLKVGRFMGLDLPVPGNVTGLNRLLYKDGYQDVCKSTFWNHRTEKAVAPASVKCSEIIDSFPFAQSFRELF